MSGVKDIVGYKRKQNLFCGKRRSTCRQPVDVLRYRVVSAGKKMANRCTWRKCHVATGDRRFRIERFEIVVPSVWLHLIDIESPTLKLLPDNLGQHFFMAMFFW